MKKRRLLSDVLSELLPTMFIHLDMNLGAEVPFSNRFLNLGSAYWTLQSHLPPSQVLATMLLRVLIDEER